MLSCKCSPSFWKIQLYPHSLECNYFPEQMVAKNKSIYSYGNSRQILRQLSLHLGMCLMYFNIFSVHIFKPTVIWSILSPTILCHSVLKLTGTKKYFKKISYKARLKNMLVCRHPGLFFLSTPSWSEKNFFITLRSYLYLWLKKVSSGMSIKKLFWPACFL